MSKDKLQQILDHIENRDQNNVLQPIDDAKELLKAIQEHLEQQQNLLMIATQDYTSELSQFIYISDILENVDTEEPAHKLVDRIVNNIREAKKLIQDTLNHITTMEAQLQESNYTWNLLTQRFPAKINSSLQRVQDEFRRIQAMFRSFLTQISVIPAASKGFLDNISNYAKHLVLRPEPDQRRSPLENFLTVNLTTMVSLPPGY